MFLVEIELTGQRIKYLTGVFRQSLIGILHAIKCKVPNYSRESATNQSADSVTSDNEPKKKNSKTTCDMPMCHKYKDFYFRHMPICLEKRSCKEPNCNVENVRLGFQHWLITCGNVKRCEMCKPLERIKRKRSNRETFEEIKKYLRHILYFLLEVFVVVLCSCIGMIYNYKILRNIFGMSSTV